MSFLFDFGLDEASERSVEETRPAVPLAPPKIITVDSELALKRVEVIAEVVPTKAGPLLKRNVADVKFEIAASDDMKSSNTLAEAVVSQTDLIPGVYEGGLKTWECAVDLVNYLTALNPAELTGKRVIELGCGSALPGIFCLKNGACVYFQDYNEDVLRLVTIPNVLLNTSNEPCSNSTDVCEVEIEFSKLATLPVKFWAGDWALLRETFCESAESGSFDIVLTSETIYASESHDKLLELIKTIIKPNGVLYIAAKHTYFGCSGSLPLFIHRLRQDSRVRCVETVWVETESVRREIVRVLM